MEHFSAQWNSQGIILLNVLAAMLFGGLIGLERELAKKPAGLRTLMLVAGASAMLVGLGDPLIEHFAAEAYDKNLRADPLRMVEAIITGISFLGAGTIFRSGKEGAIEGLTTAASILICCVIGIAVALYQWVLAAGVTVFAVIILRAAAALERLISKKR